MTPAPLPSTLRPSRLLALLLALTLALPLGPLSSGCCPEVRPVEVQADPTPRAPLPVRPTPRLSEEAIRALGDAAIEGDPAAVVALIAELKAERRDDDARGRDGHFLPETPSTH